MCRFLVVDSSWSKGQSVASRRSLSSLTEKKEKILVLQGRATLNFQKFEILPLEIDDIVLTVAVR